MVLLKPEVTKAYFYSGARGVQFPGVRLVSSNKGFWDIPDGKEEAEGIKWL
jgi:hypothetical protein